MREVEDGYYRKRREAFLAALVARAPAATAAWAASDAVVTVDGAAPHGGPVSTATLTDRKGQTFTLTNQQMAKGFRLLLADRLAHRAATGIENMSAKARDRVLVARSVHDAEAIEPGDLDQVVQLALYGKITWRTRAASTYPRKVRP